MSEFRYAFFDGKIVEIENAKVSIMTNALQYGTALFSGIRGYYNDTSQTLSVFRIKEHYRRFLSSIQILGCDFAYSVDELIEVHTNLAIANKPNCNCYFRPFAYASNCKLGPNLANTTLAYALYMIKLEDYLPTDHGLSVMISSWHRVSDSAIPVRGKFSGAYINSALAKKDAVENGFDEAILLNGIGHVCEGSAENIFIVRDGILITPPFGDDILEGVTRKTVIKLAYDLQIPFVERSIDRSELYIADEIFLTGTGCQIAWIKSVDHRTIANGEIGAITSKLKDMYLAVAHGKMKEYMKWCTLISV
jgi:branched-chain amino acid aminotransferase